MLYSLSIYITAYYAMENCSFVDWIIELLVIYSCLKFIEMYRQFLIVYMHSSIF